MLVIYALFAEVKSKACATSTSCWFFATELQLYNREFFPWAVIVSWFMFGHKELHKL
jgi:hypothetical protein